MYKYFDSNWTQRNVDTLALTKRIDANQIHEQPFPTNNICARQLCLSMHAHTHVRARSERDERHKRYIHTLTTTHKASTHPSTSIARGKHAHTRTRRNHRSKKPPTTKLNKLNLISSTCHKSIKCRHLYVWKQWQISLYIQSCALLDSRTSLPLLPRRLHVHICRYHFCFPFNNFLCNNLGEFICEKSKKRVLLGADSLI